MQKILAIFLTLIFMACSGSNANSAKAGDSSSSSVSNKLYITVNGTKMSATLVDNSSTRALLEKLAEGPITYEADDYGNFEKVGNLPWELPRNDEDITTVPGDLILYLGKRFVIYYDQNQWDFTRLGKVDDKTQAELKAILKASEGPVNITLSLE